MNPFIEITIQRRILSLILEDVRRLSSDFQFPANELEQIVSDAYWSLIGLYIASWIGTYAYIIDRGNAKENKRQNKINEVRSNPLRTFWRILLLYYTTAWSQIDNEKLMCQIPKITNASMKKFSFIYSRTNVTYVRYI